MICNDCIKKDVCKHKEYLDKYTGLELSKCDYKKAGNTDSPALPNITTVQEQPKMTREEINAKILELTNTNKPKPKLRRMISCSVCGATDFEDNMSKCSRCNKWVCSDCSIELPDMFVDTNSPMTTEVVCDNCWNAPEIVEDICNEEGGNDGDK